MVLRTLLSCSIGLLCTFVLPLKAQSVIETAATAAGDKTETPFNSTASTELADQSSPAVDAPAGKSPVGSDTAGSVEPVTNAVDNTGFFKRLIQAYRDDWHPGSATGEAPKFRGYPAPYQIPHFLSPSGPLGARSGSDIPTPLPTRSPLLSTAASMATG